MITDKMGQILHDRATRGEPLSEQEHQDLMTWYAAQDAMESQMLDATASDLTDITLSTQVDAIMQQLTTVTQSIQKITRENAVLRQEIQMLRRQVTRHFALQPA